ncbi:MAG: hypothetical protein HY275_02125 [Gemmatimonadetes bacterium]|nr:hypothetical protein [Gemmatimonadota bacterium]
MIGGFKFEDAGRTYTCTVEAPRDRPLEVRWWFSVSGDQQRYAPIEAKSGDTQASVKQRILAFYHNRLHALAQPPVRRQFGGPARAATPKPVAAVVVEPTEAS